MTVTFLGLSGSALNDPLELARPILSRDEIGLEIFALGELDPAFQAPLDEFKNACAEKSAVKIARSRIHLSYPFLFMTQDDWAVKFSQLQKMGWPLAGGIFATQPRDTKNISTVVVPNNLIDLTDRLLERARGFYEAGVALREEWLWKAAEAQFRESARIYARLVSLYNQANLLNDVNSAMKGHAKSLESAGDCINKHLARCNRHLEEMLERRDASFENWSRNILEVMALFERALRTYEMAEAAPFTLDRVRRKLERATSYYSRIQDKLDRASSPHTDITG